MIKKLFSQSIIIGILISIHQIFFLQLVNGQDLGGLPGCGQTCLMNAFATGGSSTGCSQTDFACLCKSASFLTASADCYQKSCPATDLPAATNWGIRTCASIGVNVTTVVPSIAPAGTNSSATNPSSGTTTTPSGNRTNTASNAANAAARSSADSIHYQSIGGLTLSLIAIFGSIIIS